MPLFEDPVSRALLSRIERLAPTDATVLVTGETGTGKELVARVLHARSARSERPFVAVNCGALTSSLLESELFGHEKGAFTGAVDTRPGWFEAAEGGTLLLDEIGELPLPAQVKLLRVLQEREVVRVGSRRPTRVDVRVIAATHADLGAAVATGRFREDLYYRIQVAHLEIAPLRQRRGDILPLARRFLALHAARLGIARAELGELAVKRLLEHPWPGNVRELENAIHRALIVAGPGDVVVAADDLGLVGGAGRGASAPGETAAAPADVHAALERALVDLFEQGGPNLHEGIEDIVFRTAYEFSERNQLRTARILDVSRNVVRARLLRHGHLRGATTRSAAAVGRGSLARARVRVGVQPFGALSLREARHAIDDGLAENDAEVEWVELDTGMQVVDALAAGMLDLGVVGEVPPVFAQAASAHIAYLAAEPPAPEGEAIVVLEGSPVRALRDLRGKTVAVTQGANVVYLVARALEEAGLALGDVELHTLPPADARAAFESGSVDAWATWNPHLTVLRGAVPVRVLRDARGLASNRAFYVARRSFAQNNRKLVDAFVGRLGSAVRPVDDEAMASQQQIADTFYRLRWIERPLHVEEAVWRRRSAANRSA